jgi:hypothetical protein
MFCSFACRHVSYGLLHFISGQSPGICQPRDGSRRFGWLPFQGASDMSVRTLFWPTMPAFGFAVDCQFAPAALLP